MEAKNSVKSRIANGFFLNKDFRIEDEYEAAITEKYAAKVQSLDFSKTVEAAKVIDGYISNVTEGKIHDMVKANDVNSAFSLIVNAIYFTAKWAYVFDKNKNTKRNFFSSETSRREIEFMNANYVTRLYAEDDDFQVLSLPYRDDTYAFNIFLPKRWFALKELKKTINGTRIQSLLSKLQDVFVSVSIPKIKIETGYKLKDALIKMGITDLFDDNADLTRITKSSPLKVSDASHRAIIEVDEEGTTAAAATTFGFYSVMARTYNEVPLSFIADHPFLFVLTKDKSPLFMGQFV